MSILRTSPRYFICFVLAFLLFITACEPLQVPPPQDELNPNINASAEQGVLDAQNEIRPDSGDESSMPGQTDFDGACFGLDAALPAGFLEAIQGSGMLCSSESDDEAARFTPNASDPVGVWVYALAARFPTVREGISLDEWKSYLQEPAKAPFNRLVVKESDLPAVKSLLGNVSINLEGVPEEDLVDLLWQEPDTWALVPFEDLEPRLKVIKIEGSSPLETDFDPQHWTLGLPIGLVKAYNSVNPDLLQEFVELMPRNWDAEKMAAVMLTGVTALARATAVDMERYGVLYPQEVIGDTLRAADLLHISNEVPFAKDCPDPVGIMPNLVFCSKERYLRLLEDIGTDIVELTGDHLNDWGPEALENTLRLYDEAGIGYYGGGANEREASRAITVEVKGNKLAFLGCNAKGVYSVNAGPETGGANGCNLPAMRASIARLTEEGYNVIVTFQHIESYGWYPDPNLVQDFEDAASAGAVIVSGSQAHRPHTMAFFQNSLLRYGLGNLFFDQLDVGSETDKAFLDRHIFYDNHHIATELIPLYFTDYSQPKFAPPALANELLGTLFRMSGY